MTKNQSIDSRTESNLSMREHDNDRLRACWCNIRDVDRRLISTRMQSLQRKASSGKLMGDERSIYMWNHCLEVGLGELGKNIEGVPGIRTDAENDTLLHFARKLCSSTRMIEMLETATCSIDKSDVQCSIHVNDTHTDRNEIQNNFLDWELASVGIVLYCLAALPSLRPPAQLCRGAWRDKSSVVAVMEPLLALLDHPEVRLQREAAAALAACVTEAAPVSKAVPAAIVPSPASLSPALSKKPGRRSARDVRDDISSDSDSDENGDVQPPSLSQEQEATHAALLVLDRERQRQRQQWLLHHLTASLLPRIQRAMQRQTSTRTAFLSAPSTATRVGGAKESEDLTFIPLDDTTGWGNLESLIQAYYDCIFAAGRTGAWRFVTDELACKLLVEQTAEHINRHVRELALRRWGQLCELLAEPCLETEPEQTRAAPTTSLIEEEAADYWLYYGSMVGDLVEMNGSISADSPAPVSEVTALSTTLPTTLVSPRGVSGAAPPAAAAAAQAFDAYRQRTAGAPIRVVSSGTDGNQLRLSTVTTRDDGTGRVATVVRHEERPTVGTISRPLGTLAKSSTTNNNTIANMFIKTDASSPPLQRAGMQMRIHRPMTSDSWLRPAVPCAALMAKALRAGLQDEWGQVRLAATSSAVSFLHCLRAGDENLRKQQEQQHHAALELARVQAHALTAGHSSVNGPDYEAVLRAAYTKFNPAKLTEVGTILEAFRGREKYMLEQLERKYGPIPMPWRSSGDVKGNVASTGGLTARATFQRMTQRDSSDLNGSGQTNSSSSDVTCVRWLQLYGNLVPRLCLNRFHPSHGVQAAALSAWRAVVGPTAGRALLLTHAELAAAYYLDMSRSQNHETSEAACAAMAELATVLPASTTATETVVRTMLQAVRACVQDPSWPVRDAALHSIAALLQHCSQAVLAVERDETADPAAEVPTLAMFLAACTAHLSDPLPSVRNNAAAALTMACSAADASISGPCFHHLLGMAATQLSNGNVQRVLHGPNAEAAIDASAGLTAPVRPKAFLSPQALALLQKNAHAVQSSQRVAMDVPLPPPTPTPHSHPTPPLAEQPTYPLPPPSIPANAPRSQWRRGGGWGCCLDCMVVRDRTAADALQGTVALLHQLARMPLDLVGSHWTEALEEQLSSDSGAPYLTWVALPTGQAYDCNNSGKGLRVLWGLLRAAWELVWRLQQMLKASNGSSAASRMSSPSGTMQVQMLAHVLIALQEVYSSLNANDTAATAAQQVLGADPAIQIGAKDLFTAPTSLLASALIAKWDAVPILGLLEQVQAVANELGRSGTALRAAAEDSAQMLIELRNRC